MVVELGLPDQLAGHRIERIGARQNVAKIEPLGRRVRDDCAAHFGRGPEAPSGAAAIQIERVNGAVMAADKHRPPADGGLRARANGRRVGHRPFELQCPHLVFGQPRNAGGCEAAVVVTPTDPRRRRCQIKSGVAGIAHRWLLRGFVVGQRCAYQILGNLEPLVVRQLGGLLLHDPAVHRRKNGIRRHHFEPHLLRRFGHAAIVAACAVFQKQAFAGMFLDVDRRAAA